MDNCTYTVLSPWAARKVNRALPLAQRIPSLEAAKIGVIGLFKEYHKPLAQCVKEMLAERFPQAEIETFIYAIDQKDPEDDPQNWPEFKAFLDHNDCFIEIGADGGSCSLFAGYIAGTFEKYGRPVGLFVTREFEQIATCGCGAKGFAHLRKVLQPLGMAHIPPGQDCEEFTRRVYAPIFAEHMDQMVLALTAPPDR